MSSKPVAFLLEDLGVTKTHSRPHISNDKAIKAELQRRKHHRTTEVGAWLRKVVLGYYRYHAVPGNSSPLRIFSRRRGGVRTQGSVRMTWCGQS
jgi:hypothetical protein